jgi:hypothetical protein
MIDGDDWDGSDPDGFTPDGRPWKAFGVASVPPPEARKKEHMGMFGLLPDDPEDRAQELAIIAADREACPIDANDCGLCAVRSSVLLEAQADGIYDPFEVTPS